ncbi:2-phosphosulfolactate phosphatase [Paenibacillus rhizosphaerae]|uniref:Probable 2-phosphosulfolactate phosphatase n=1 Tax=Paenibacillus rhizosphaerae TaxID=297318 RepID=A0A839TQ79_9BACL|nr:2-phosphosulfolactate phosphatase [Paenibacillus rhizosphaerae]MBB3127548.1 2-phosphosulfolactate phosphatase [Paenibacillus rhizosphaerae]
MRVDVIANVDEVRSEEFVQKSAVVIDVLRATSTMITALAQGATGLMPVETVPQAQQMRGDQTFVGGERYYKKIPGFQAGNSPHDYMTPEVAGKLVVLTTSNGTRGLLKSHKAARIFAASFMNGTACASALLSFGKDAILLCSGCRNDFSLEDGLCAGMIIDAMESISDAPLQLNDLGLAMKHTYRQCKGSLFETVMEGCAAKQLVKLGFAHDVEYCTGIDTVPVVPYAKSELILTPLFAIAANRG